MWFLYLTKESLQLSKPLFYERDGEFKAKMLDRAASENNQSEFDRELDAVFLFISHIVQSNLFMIEQNHQLNYMQCENGFQLMLKKDDHDCVFIACCSGETRSDQFDSATASNKYDTERRINALQVILKFLYGPFYDSWLCKVENKQYEWSKISLMLSKWNELYSAEQSFLVESVEEILIDRNHMIYNDCDKVFHLAQDTLIKEQSLGLNDNAIHCLLIVNNKVIKSYNSVPSRLLNSYDKLLMIILTAAYFPTHSAFDSDGVFSDPGSASLPHFTIGGIPIERLKDANKSKTKEVMDESYHSTRDSREHSTRDSREQSTIQEQSGLADYNVSPFLGNSNAPSQNCASLPVSSDSSSENRASAPVQPLILEQNSPSYNGDQDSSSEQSQNCMSLPVTSDSSAENNTSAPVQPLILEQNSPSYNGDQDSSSEQSHNCTSLPVSSDSSAENNTSAPVPPLILEQNSPSYNGDQGSSSEQSQNCASLPVSNDSSAESCTSHPVRALSPADQNSLHTFTSSLDVQVSAWMSPTQNLSSLPSEDDRESMSDLPSPNVEEYQRSSSQLLKDVMVSSTSETRKMLIRPPQRITRPSSAQSVRRSSYCSVEHKHEHGLNGRHVSARSPAIRRSRSMEDNSAFPEEQLVHRKRRGRVADVSIEAGTASRYTSESTASTDGYQSDDYFCSTTELREELQDDSYAGSPDSYCTTRTDVSFLDAADLRERVVAAADPFYVQKELFVHARVFLGDSMPCCLYVLPLGKGIRLVLAAENSLPQYITKWLELLEPPAKRTDLVKRIKAIKQDFKAQDLHTHTLLDTILDKLSTGAVNDQVLKAQGNNLKDLFCRHLVPLPLCPSPSAARAKIQALELLKQKSLKILSAPKSAFLHVKADKYLPMTAFYNEFPGLLHFIFVKRKKNSMQAPSIITGETDSNLMNAVLHDLKRRLWRVVPCFYRQLARGFPWMMLCDGDFMFTFELEVFDEVTLQPKLMFLKQPELYLPKEEAIGCFQGTFYNRLLHNNKFRLETFLCLELITVHLAAVPETVIEKQRKRLLHDTLYKRT